MGYDENGNTAQKGTQRFYYDYRDQLVRATDGTVETRFKYDVFGRRIEKKTRTKATRHYYDGIHIIEERDGADRLVQGVFNRISLITVLLATTKYRIDEIAVPFNQERLKSFLFLIGRTDSRSFFSIVVI